MSHATLASSVVQPEGLQAEGDKQNGKKKAKLRFDDFIQVRHFWQQNSPPSVQRPSIPPPPPMELPPADPRRSYERPYPSYDGDRGRPYPSFERPYPSFEPPYPSFERPYPSQERPYSASGYPGFDYSRRGQPYDLPRGADPYDEPPYGGGGGYVNRSRSPPPPTRYDDRFPDDRRYPASARAAPPPRPMDNRRLPEHAQPVARKISPPRAARPPIAHHAQPAPHHAQSARASGYHQIAEFSPPRSQYTPSRVPASFENPSPPASYKRPSAQPYPRSRSPIAVRPSTGEASTPQQAQYNPHSSVTSQQGSYQYDLPAGLRQPQPIIDGSAGPSYTQPSYTQMSNHASSSLHVTTDRVVPAGVRSPYEGPGSHMEHSRPSMSQAQPTSSGISPPPTTIHAPPSAQIPPRGPPRSASPAMAQAYGPPSPPYSQNDLYSPERIHPLSQSHGPTSSASEWNHQRDMSLTASHPQPANVSRTLQMALEGSPSKHW